MSSRVIEIITSSFTKLLIPGLVYTIPITLISFAIGLLIAIVTALIRVKKIKVLSGGEKIRLKLCILMNQNLNLLVLDEPTNHLDLNSREVLEENLMNYSGTLLFVSHDRYFLEKMTNKIWNLENKQMEVFSGNYDEYIDIKKNAVIEETSPILRKTRK